MKYVFSLLIIHCFSQFAFTQNEKAVNELLQKVDSIQYVEDLLVRQNLLNQYFEESKRLSKTKDKAQLLRKISNRFYNVSLLEESKKVLDYNKKLSHEVGDTITLARTYKDLGDYFYTKSVNDSAFYYYQQSLKFLSTNSDTYIEALVSKAELYKNESHFIEAEKVLVEAIRIAKQNKNYRQLYDAYIVLAITQNRLKDYDEAIKSYNEAYSYLSKLKVDQQYPLLVAQTLNNLANVYVEQENFGLAIANFEKALKSDVKNISDILYAAIVDNLAYAKFKAGEKNVESLFLESLSIRAEINNRLGVVVSKKRLGEYYLSKKDSIQASLFLNDAYSLAKETNFIKELLEILQLKAKAEPKNASVYLNRHIQLKDSLLQVERITREKFAKIELDTEEVIFKNVQLNRKITIVYIVAAALLILLFLLYLFLKQRAKNKMLLLEQEQQKSNQEVIELLLEQQQNVDQARRAEKDKLAEELHDGIVSELFGTRLHITHLLAETENQEAQEVSPYIDKLNELENKIRNLSHELKSEHQFNSTGYDAILNALIEEFEYNTKLELQYEISPNIHWDEVDYTIKINLYRIFQEALTNISKYAEAKQATIAIEKQKQLLYVRIHDNGKGFDVKKTNEGIGLKNLKSRADKLKGKIQIKSSSKGTVIQLEIPL